MNHENSLQVNAVTYESVAKIIISPDPSNRKISILDKKRSREVLILGFISEHLILFKMLLKPAEYDYREGYEKD